MFDLENFDLAKEALESYDFKAVLWRDFVLADDLPEGLFARGERIWATLMKENHDASWVVYDPLDNSDGWLLIGGKEVVRESCAHIIDGQPDEGPLAKELWPDWFKKVEEVA